MDAERPALPDQAVETRGRLLRQLVLLDEELLELVHDEQDAGKGRRTGYVAKAVDVLHAGLAEPVGTHAQLGVQPLQDAEAELALALDRHDARVRQLVRRVDLELDALLEVDQVEIDLVGTVVQGEVGDERVHQGRLARTGATGEQDVLGRALPELEVLPLGRARLAERHVDPGPAVLGPQGVVGRGDELEGDLHALGVLRRGADALDLPGGELGRRGRVEHERISPEFRLVPEQAGAVPGESVAIGPDVIEREIRRHGFGRVGGDQDRGPRRAHLRRRSRRAGRRTSRRSGSGSRR